MYLHENKGCVLIDTYVVVCADENGSSKNDVQTKGYTRHNALTSGSSRFPLGTLTTRVSTLFPTLIFAVLRTWTASSLSTCVRPGPFCSLPNSSFACSSDNGFVLIRSSIIRWLNDPMSVCVFNMSMIRETYAYYVYGVHTRVRTKLLLCYMDENGWSQNIQAKRQQILTLGSSRLCHRSFCARNVTEF